MEVRDATKLQTRQYEIIMAPETWQATTN